MDIRFEKSPDFDGLINVFVDNFKRGDIWIEDRDKFLSSLPFATYHVEINADEVTGSVTGIQAERIG